jgi:hypothetical protein
MVKVIGVRFRKAGKIYFFSPGSLEIEKGQQVIVETARGVEFGNVVMGIKDVEDEEITQPLKAVIRVATEEDKEIEEKIREGAYDGQTVMVNNLGWITELQQHGAMVYGGRGLNVMNGAAAEMLKEAGVSYQLIGDGEKVGNLKDAITGAYETTRKL